MSSAVSRFLTSSLDMPHLTSLKSGFLSREQDDAARDIDTARNIAL